MLQTSVRPGEAEAEIVVLIRRGVVIAPGRTTAVEVIDPAAAPKDAVRARRGSRRVRLIACRIGIIPVMTPLPHVAAQVVRTRRARTVHRRNAPVWVHIGPVEPAHR